MGTAALIGIPAAKAASTVSVWGLDPDGGHEACGCSACAACRIHALNKIFASAADADTGRAHPYCRCAVTQLSAVEPGVFEALFVSGGRRSSVDRRWQWVQAALALAAPVPLPLLAAPPPAPADGSTTPEATTAGSWPPRALVGTATASTVRAAWIRRDAPGRRALFVQVDTDHEIEAEIRLIRHRKQLLRRLVPTVNGRQTVRISLPAEITPGPARLQVRLTEAAGARHTATRMLSVPAKQAPNS